MITVAAVVEFLDRLAPPGLAADWDNVGLLLGDPTAEAQRVMTCLTVTPEAAAEAVESGARLIGQYSQCSFRLAGTGTFFGSEAAHPAVGQKGRREEVSEWRLEAVCPEDRVGQAIASLRRAHSYEEPAYDVYPLRPTP